MKIKPLVWDENKIGDNIYLSAKSFVGNVFIQNAYIQGVKSDKFFAEIREDCYYDDVIWQSSLCDTIENTKKAVRQEFAKMLLDIINTYAE